MANNPLVHDTYWNQLDDIPFHGKARGAYIQLNSKNLIFSSAKWIQNYKDDKHGIYKYNIAQEEWELFMEWSDLGLTNLYSVTTHFDENKNLLYVFYKKSPFAVSKKILTINMDNKQYLFINTDVASNSASIVCTKDHIHTVGGHINMHYTFDKKTGKTELIHTFQQFDSMLASRLVHIDSLNVILLIGGYNKGEYIHCFRYCIKTKRWKEIKNIKFPLANFCAEVALLTKDEKHVIVPIRSGSSNDIYIIDIFDKDIYQLRKSKIESPTIGRNTSTYFALSGDRSDDSNRLLIWGFLRQCKSELPNDVIGIICKYCGEELLHCFRVCDGSNEHFVVLVSDVIHL